MSDTIDPEIKTALDELREMATKQPEVQTRLDAIEESAAKREQAIVEVRGTLDELKQQMEEREALIKKLQQEARQTRLEQDPKLERRRGFELLGMMCREHLCMRTAQELPTRFRKEADALKEFREQRATLEAGAVTGSYLVPTILEAGEFWEAVEELSDLLSSVDFIPDLPGQVNLPYLASRPTAQKKRTTVDTTMTQSDPTFGLLEIRPDEMYVYFPLDNRLMQMSALPLGQLAFNLCRDALIYKMCSWLLIADGSATYNSLTGILNEATYVLNMSGGKTAFGNIDNTELNRALAKLWKRGRSRGSFLMSLYVLGFLENLNRSGKMPVLTADQGRGSYRCKMRPVIIEEEMPDEADDAADTGFMGVGDLATYMVGLVGGIQLASSADYKFGENQTAFRGVINVDIKRKPQWTHMTLKTAAS